MKDIRVDHDGEFRCWNCGNKGLLEKRTFRSKMLIGVGAMLTKKKLKCQTCGEYNDTGNAKPYTGPESRKWRKQWEKTEASKTAAQRNAEVQQAQTQADALTSALVAAASEMRAAPPSIEAHSSASTLPPPAPGADLTAGWLADPSGRHELRYWDGSRWTEHVSDAGAPSTDPV